MRRHGLGGLADHSAQTSQGGFGLVSGQAVGKPVVTPGRDPVAQERPDPGAFEQAVFAELQSALDRIWHIPAAPRDSGVWSLIRKRLLSFGLILGLGFMLVISLVASAGLAALGKWWGSWFTGWEILLQVLNFAISFAVFTGLFSVIYKYLPSVRLAWHDVRAGAVATTILFIIGKYLIGLYLGRAGMTSGFGAAGSFALLLAWIYYSAQIFLLGAEFTWVYANRYGSRAQLPVSVA